MTSNRNDQLRTNQPATTAWFTDAQLALSLLCALGFTVGVSGATLAMKFGWVFVPVLMLIAGALTCGQAMVWTYHLGVKAGRAQADGPTAATARDMAWLRRKVKKGSC